MANNDSSEMKPPPGPEVVLDDETNTATTEQQEGAASAAVELAAPEPSARASRQLPAGGLAKLSQAKKLRKTRLSLGNFVVPSTGAGRPSAADLTSGNSSSSVSSFGSAPSDFDDLCNNN